MLLRMRVLTESATASEQAENRRKRGRQEAPDRADDLIARFGTFLLRVRALTEGPNASETGVEQTLNGRSEHDRNLIAGLCTLSLRVILRIDDCRCILVLPVTESAGLSQIQVAKLVGISPAKLSLVENHLGSLTRQEDESIREAIAQSTKEPYFHE
jgi:hypothetical protein